MHYHKCKEPTTNGQVCGQIVAVADGVVCPQCKEDHYCSLHHPDPAHRVEPTPPLKR